MKKHGISQEQLKVIACVSMLLDHTGAVLFPGVQWLRVVGRIAFPVYCFLLCEGIHYTAGPVKYGLRLTLGMILSELPYDMALHPGSPGQSQSVMVTLLIGFITVETICRVKWSALKFLAAAGGFLLAEILNTDYGGWGVLLILLFSQSRGQWWLQTIALAMVAWMMNSYRLHFHGFTIPVEMFAVFAMIPIGLYSGKKKSASRMIQWMFYLFYPVHLAVLAVIRMR